MSFSSSLKKKKIFENKEVKKFLSKHIRNGFKFFKIFIYIPRLPANWNYDQQVDLSADQY